MRTEQTQTAAPNATGRVPEFFLVGQPKAGSTAIYEMLLQHPGVYLPERKEPRFFVEELLERDAPRPGGTPKTLAEYESWYADARPDQVAGDTSPTYLWSRTAARRIQAAKPDAKIMMVLREPASLLRSLHMELVELYVEDQTDFRTAIELEPRRREGKDMPRHTHWPALLMYSEQVRYVEQVSRFTELFPGEQIKIMIYDDFRADNEGTMREIMRFIGVDDSVELERREANPTVRVRSGAANRLFHSVVVGHGPISRAAKATARAVTPEDWRKRAFIKTKRTLLFTEPEPADPQFMAELRERYRDDVRALSEMLGRDLLTLWGYAPETASSNLDAR